MAVPGVVLLIPTFLVLKELQLFNSYPGMILPLVTDAAGVFIMRQFFLTVPPAIEEAAKIDGAGIFRTYWSVVLPMARPALLTLMILSFQGSWNNFSLILVAHSSPSLDTLTTGVGRLVSGQLGAGHAVPAAARRRAGDDRPGGGHLLRVPEIHHAHRRGRHQGVSPNPNTVTRPGSPKDRTRRMPDLVTVSTQTP